MRAALLTSPGEQLEIVDDVEVDEPTGRQVLVKISHCGVCHSDLHVIDGGLPGRMPTILGHEAAGVIEAVGAGVTELAAGDTVILTLKPVCGRCYYCVRGQQSQCSAGSLMGPAVSPLHRNGEPVYPGIGVGAFAEYAVVSADAAVKVPDDTPTEIACVLGCAVQTGVGAVLNTAKVEEGATVLVQGLGGVGISIIQGARLAGASAIIAVDTVAERRDQAGHFGATHVIDPADGPVQAHVAELTGGIGVDYAFDAVGMPQLVETGIAACRPGGLTVAVGVPGMADSFAVPSLPFVLAEKRLSGCFLGTSNPHQEFNRLLALWRAGRLDLEAMVTHRRPIAEVNEAFDDMKAGRGIRTVLSMA